MPRATTKTPTEIRIQAEQAAANARVREAKSLAADNPMLSQVDDRLTDVNKDIASLSRQMNGPQSFDNRRTAFELRLDAVNAGQNLADAQDAHYRELRTYYKNALESLAENLANDEPVEQAMIDDIFAEAPLPHYDDLAETATTAANAWRDYSAERNAKKAKPASTEQTEETAN